MKTTVEIKLASWGVDTSHGEFLDFATFDRDFKGVFEDPLVLENLLMQKSVRYLYIDSAEDMGLKELE
jgi:hypothetical protein